MRHYPFRPIRQLVVALFAVIAAVVMSGHPGAPAFAQAGSIDAATQELFDAIHAKDFAAAQASVEEGARVDVPGRWGMTAIELAIDKGYFKIAHYLVAVRNFRDDGTESKSRRVASPSAPAQGPQDQSPQDQAGNVQPSAPVAATTRPAASEPGPVATSPFAVPSQRVGTLTNNPFYAPLAELETTAGREAETDGPAWPAGKPNPFDPQMPAVGSSLQVIGEIGSADPGIAFRPAGEFGRPTLETESIQSLDTPSPPSAGETSGASPAPPAESKKGPGLGGGVIGETNDFQ